LSTRYKEWWSFSTKRRRSFLLGIDSKLAQPRVKNKLKKIYWNEVE
jgi:hypothetical protein